MIPARSHRALYAAFDRFPSRKGSAVHIDRFARALFEQAGGGLLYVLGGDELPAYQREGAVEIVRYMREAEHVLERAAGLRGAAGGAAGAAAGAASSRTSATRGAARRSSSTRTGATRRSTRSTGCRRSSCRSSIPRSRRRSWSGSPRSSGAAWSRPTSSITPSDVTAARLAARSTRSRDPQRRRPPARPRRRTPDAPGALPPVLRRAAALAGRRHGAARASPACRPRRPRPRDLRVGAPAPRQAATASSPRSSRSPIACTGTSRCPEHELARLARARAALPRAAEGLQPQRRAGLRAAEDPRVDGLGHAGDRVRPPGLREIMRDGEHGRLVAPDRPGELARAIRVALDYPRASGRSMGEAARPTSPSELSGTAAYATTGPVHRAQADWIAA